MECVSGIEKVHSIKLYDSLHEPKASASLSGTAMLERIFWVGYKIRKG